MADMQNVFVVCDANVRQYALEIAGGRPLLAITADEEHKSPDAVLSICRWLLEQGADRDAVVYAVGGGCTSDVVGFAASIYKRGVLYANFPTTLLSMVDASIGGKTGVNLDGYKNMLGLTRFPSFVNVNPSFLSTLPRRELRSGAAEMLKTFIIDDGGRHYEEAVQVLSGPLDISALTPLIQAAGEVKRRIVERDPYESGARRFLNLGHTYGHAIEWWQAQDASRPRFSHGEAVAIGIVQAARLSEKMGLCREGLSAKIASDFALCGLPVDLPCEESSLAPAIRRDKKAEGGHIRFVVIEKIGKVSVINVPAPQE